MSKPFFETTRSLKADGFRGAYVALILVALFSAAWGWWFFFGKVATWEITGNAILEVNGKAFVVDAPISGKVSEQFLEVDRKVKKGDALVVLETGLLKAQIQKENLQITNLQAQVKAAQAQGEANIHAYERSLEETRNLIEKTEAQLKAGKASLAIKEDLANRYERLIKEKLVSEVDYLKARSELETARGDVNAQALSLKLYRTQQSTTSHQLTVARTLLEERITQLQGQIEESQGNLKRMALEVEERTIRAPVAGTIGQAAPLQPGSFVGDGYGICTIIPDGEARVLARFQPGVTLGRIQPGQEARMRLHGFPWTQYGMLTARVSKVASEPRDGLVHVDLEIVGDPPPEIPLQHGMPGAVEIQIGKRTPLELVLRAVGIRLQGEKEDRS